MTYSGTPDQHVDARARAGPCLSPACHERPAAAGAGVCDERRRDGLHVRRDDRGGFRAGSGDRTDEKLALLDEKLQRGRGFFMNIHARFLFENRFYEKRREGMVSQEELNKLMEEAQKEAFSGALGEAASAFLGGEAAFLFDGRAVL